MKIDLKQAGVVGILAVVLGGLSWLAARGIVSAEIAAPIVTTCGVLLAGSLRSYLLPPPPPPPAVPS
jgi:hypothetical protein